MSRGSSQSSGFPTRSNIKWPVQLQKMARKLTFRILKEDELYYQCSENKGADQLCSYCTADLRICFRLGKIQFSHGEARDSAGISSTLNSGNSFVAEHVWLCICIIKGTLRKWYSFLGLKYLADI